MPVEFWWIAGIITAIFITDQIVHKIRTSTQNKLAQNPEITTFNYKDTLKKFIKSVDNCIVRIAHHARSFCDPKDMFKYSCEAWQSGNLLEALLVFLMLGVILYALGSLVYAGVVILLGLA